MKKMLVLLAILMLFNSCGKKGTTKPGEKLVFIRSLNFEQVFQSQQKPTWITDVPETLKDGRLWFVAKSGYFQQEQDALDDAYNSAIKQVAKYIGTDVRTSEQVIRTSLGKSSSIIDATVSRKQIEQFFTDAVAKRVKQKSNYLLRHTLLYRKGRKEIKMAGVTAWVLVYADKATLDREIKRKLDYQNELKKNTIESYRLISSMETDIYNAEQKKQSDPEQADTLINSAEGSKRKILGLVRPYPEINRTKLDAILSGLQLRMNSVREFLQKDPEVALRLAIGSFQQNKGQKLRIALASVTYADSGLPAEFSRHFAAKFEAVASGMPQRFILTGHDVLERRIKAAKWDFNKLVDRGMYGLDGIVFVTWEEKGRDNLEVTLNLKQLRTGKLLKSAVVTLPRSLFPTCYDFVPNRDTVLAARFLKPRKPEKGFEISIWPEKGNGSFLKKGEFVRFNLRATRNCYIYIYNYTSSGKLYLIHPWKKASNFLPANKTITIPDPKKSNIVVQPPFGTEIVKVIATLKPIPELRTKWQFYDISDLSMFGPYKSLQYRHTAEARCSMKTVEK